MRDTERERETEAETQAEGEAGSTTESPRCPKIFVYLFICHWITYNT